MIDYYEREPIQECIFLPSDLNDQIQEGFLGTGGPTTEHLQNVPCSRNIS